MTPAPPAKRLLWRFPPLLAITALLCGCNDAPRAVGPDIAWLDAPLTRDVPEEKGKTLLPLTTGAFWEMTTYVVSASSPLQDRLVVTGPITVDGISSVEIKLFRGGKPWRREIYRETGHVLQLVATQDENSGLMRYQPPIPLLRYPATEGDYMAWDGKFVLGKDALPARALSRISGREKMKAPAGVFKTLRLDTVIEVSRGDGTIRFPSVRWLAPGIGFVRRAFAEKGNPAFSEVSRFNVP
jgi:hypothetical protein